VEELPILDLRFPIDRMHSAASRLSLLLIANRQSKIEN
jgi:hypothetical protein